VDSLIKINLSRLGWEQMRAHVEKLAPEEACGLVAGRRLAGEYHAEAVLELANILHSRTRYRIDPQEQLDAFNLIDEQNLDLIAIYHSHPNGPDHPSPTDIAEAYYPDAVYLIWSAASREWHCRGYHIRDGKSFEIALVLRS
jgi:proteasome lid subunit RPN8/RPN11